MVYILNSVSILNYSHLCLCISHTNHHHSWHAKSIFFPRQKWDFTYTGFYWTTRSARQWQCIHESSDWRLLICSSVWRVICFNFLYEIQLINVTWTYSCCISMESKSNLNSVIIFIFHIIAAIIFEIKKYVEWVCNDFCYMKLIK